jgi:hypothetical protein
MTSRDAIFALHGVILLLAFVVMFPAGFIAMKSRSPEAFKYHWMLQLAASVLTAIGVFIGLVLAPNIASARHKQLGITIIILLVFQVVSGWRHHVVFLKIRQPTWISNIHIWLGRFIIGAGWCNIVTGLSLGGFSDLYLYIAGATMCLEATSLMFLHYGCLKTSAKKEAENFALVDDSDSDEENARA